VLDSVDVFDPSVGRWKYLRLSGPRVDSSVVALDRSRILVIGGRDQTEGELASSEIVDLDAARDRPAPPAKAFARGPRRAVPLAPRAPPEEPPVLRYARRAERPHDYALVVGVEAYSNLPPAEFAESDAHEVSEALGALGVPEENIVVLTGAKASLSEISKYVEEWLPKQTSADSRVYFYFSDHGAPDVKDGSAYLMPVDGDSAFVKSTGFPLTRLYAALGNLPARHVVAILDSCFSGAGGRSVVAAGARPLVSVRLPESVPSKLSILAASGSDEIAGSLPSSGHGLFSYYLLKGLSGAADEKGGHVTLAELHAYVRKHVIIDARRQNREQAPTLSTPTPKLRLY
jgi:hypothetical protein